MRARMPLLAAMLAGMFAFLNSSSPTLAGVIFSDFGPGYSFNTSNGWTVSTESAIGTYTLSIGFTALISADLSQIDIPIQNFQGPNSGGTTVSLYNRSGSTLGSRIAFWTLGSLPTFTSNNDAFSTILGISGVHLAAGQSYYLQAHAAPTDWDYWMYNDQSVTNWFIQFNPAYPSTATPSIETSSAFALLSSPSPVPEPPSFSLFGAGLGALLLFAWRRKKKAAALEAA